MIKGKKEMKKQISAPATTTLIDAEFFKEGV